MAGLGLEHRAPIGTVHRVSSLRLLPDGPRRDSVTVLVCPGINAVHSCLCASPSPGKHLADGGVYSRDQFVGQLLLRDESLRGILLFSSMPRATSASQPRPLYRQILRDALSLAWKEKRFWPLAILAVFLQTGGIYDVFFFSVRKALQAPVPHDSLWQGYFARVGELDWINRFALTQSALLSLALIFLILMVAVLAQGVLIACLDRGLATAGRSFRQILQAAAKRIVPLAVLNLLLVGITGLFSLGLKTFSGVVSTLPGGGFLFVIAAVIYLVVLFVTTALHFFSLNGIMADGMTLHEALVHAWQLLSKAWLTVAEAAFCMMIIGSLLFGAAGLIAFLAGLPAVGFLVASLYLGLPKIFIILNILIVALVFVVAVLGGLFAVNFQYAVWNRLYRRAVEGTAHSKIIRTFRALTSRGTSRAAAK